MLSESLVHGLDIARGTEHLWPTGPDEARPVLGQSMPTMMAPAPDTAEAQGVSIAFDLRIKGGPRPAAVVEDGTMTVTRDAPPRAYDCTITAAPTTFLLVSFRRTRSGRRSHAATRGSAAVGRGSPCGSADSSPVPDLIAGPRPEDESAPWDFVGKIVMPLSTGAGSARAVGRAWMIRRTAGVPRNPVAERRISAAAICPVDSP
ncbi:hypothetical protein ACFVH0_34570 [Streptomyces sp. NPDC127117]|uniref:hypothetical protein n=1 Tax=Streptomyces sp. NPDC127117 TaxID=3345368 RepID=UPI00363810D0